MTTFEQSRTCSGCESEETRKLGKLQAAFIQNSRWEEPCRKCGTTQFSTTSLSMPKLDAEIMETWAADESLNLMDQDEDTILASERNFELLKEHVVRDDVGIDKRSILLSAICVLIYDSDDTGDGQLSNGAIDFLKSNRHLFGEIGDGAIFDYVKKVVYPKIGKTFVASTV